VANPHRVAPVRRRLWLGAFVALSVVAAALVVDGVRRLGETGDAGVIRVVLGVFVLGYVFVGVINELRRP